MKLIIIIPVCVAAFFCINEASAQVPSDYKGQPYRDEVYTLGAQTIPGRVELAYYDLGGEGIAYHDVTNQNEGALYNKRPEQIRPGIPDYIAYFRENEGVDITYAKDNMDFSHPNKVNPKVNQLYIGWQGDGEWTNYTVNILKPGRYQIITIYSNAATTSELLLNGKPAATLVMQEKTEGYHNWTQAKIGEITFPTEGLNLITFKYAKDTNVGFFDFIYMEELK